MSGGRPWPTARLQGSGGAPSSAETQRLLASAYFDRLFRSLSTQAKVIERVERAGGSVLAVDFGRVTNGSAGQ